jgi:uncharacterized protein
VAAARLVGVVSDTHGLLRPEVVRALRGVERIVHAGDVGSASVLEQLGAVAPVVAVRGNNDRGAWAARLPATEVVEFDGALLYLIHDLAELDLDPAVAGFHVVVSGHSHRPKIERRDGVLYLNPGSIGPRRFTLPVAFARLRVRGCQVGAEIEELS